MAPRYLLREYVHAAMAQAVYEKIQDATWSGRIPSCKGVLAFPDSRRACGAEIHSTLEDWIPVGLKLGHPLPMIADIDLNEEPTREPVDTP